MSEPIRIQVNAGNHERKLSLVSIPVDPQLPLANLYREGKQRPIPAQVESQAHQARLWWQLEDLAATQSIEYVLKPGARQREGTAKIRMVPGAAGFVVSIGDIKWAEIFVPPVGSASFHLWSEGRRIATAKHLAQNPLLHATADDSISKSLHYFREGDPAPVSGPVFSSLNFRQRVLFSKRRPAWSQLTGVRVMHGPAGGFILDLEVVWIADAGPIALRSQSGVTDLSVCPTFSLQTSADFAATWHSISGRTGTELEDCFTDGMLARGSISAVAAYANSSNDTSPNRWSFARQDRTAYAVAVTRRDGGDPAIPLGDIAKWRWRILVGHAALLAEQMRERYLDFDVPPSVQKTESGTDSDHSPLTSASASLPH